jgi:hypothetical protein
MLRNFRELTQTYANLTSMEWDHLRIFALALSYSASVVKQPQMEGFCWFHLVITYLSCCSPLSPLCFSFVRDLFPSIQIYRPHRETCRSAPLRSAPLLSARSLCRRR